MLISSLFIGELRWECLGAMSIAALSRGNHAVEARNATGHALERLARWGRFDGMLSILALFMCSGSPSRPKSAIRSGIKLDSHRRFFPLFQVE